MITTTELLDAAKHRAGITSEYRLCRTVGVSDQCLRNWRIGRSVPDEKHAAALAEMAGVDVGYVLASMAAERAKDDGLRAAWANLARRLEGLAASVLAVLVLGVGLVVSPDASAMAKAPAPAAAGSPAHTLISLCILCKLAAAQKLTRCITRFSQILRPAPSLILA